MCGKRIPYPYYTVFSYIHTSVLPFWMIVTPFDEREWYGGWDSRWRSPLVDSPFNRHGRFLLYDIIHSFDEVSLRYSWWMKFTWVWTGFVPSSVKKVKLAFEGSRICLLSFWSTALFNIFVTLPKLMLCSSLLCSQTTLFSWGRFYGVVWIKKEPWIPHSWHCSLILANHNITSIMC